MKKLLELTALLLISSITNAAGFDQDYEVRYGDSSGDGVSDDLYVRRKPRIVLLFVDIITPIVIRGDVDDVLLEYAGDGTFTMVSGLTSAQKSQYAQWPIADVEVAPGDINADGFTDLVIKGVSQLAWLSSAMDQILFADTNADSTPPMHLRAIDDNVRSFFRDLSGNLENRHYYLEAALANNWYHVEEGQEITAYWAIDYLGFWNFCWVNCTVVAADTNPDDIYNPAATPDLCFFFACQWINGRWHAWVTAQDLDLVIEYEEFNQAALGLVDVIDVLLSAGEVHCGSTQANAMANAVQSILGVGIMGDVLSSCGILENESDFDPSDLPRIRLGKLYVSLQRMSDRLDEAGDPGEESENQADLSTAISYLMGSQTFQDMWEQFQDIDVDIVVHRNPGDIGSNFDADNPEVLTWDPDSGLLVEAGVSSPASALAHEIAHAVRYHNDEKGFLDDYPVPVISSPAGTVFGTSLEEARATDIEKAIRAELGEPARIDYKDGTQRLNGPNTDILVGDPTFSCFGGNPVCDDIIEASQ
jgi:hypothetical protein